MKSGAQPIAIAAARARVEVTRVALLQRIDELPGAGGGDTRVANDEVGEALLDFRAAKDALDVLEHAS